MTNGMKFDDGKVRFGLVPPSSLKQIAAVMTFGAQKYLPNNWQQIPDGVERYTESLLRHVEAFRSGEHVDPDFRLHHLAHAGCCVMFLLWFLEQDGEVPQFEDLSVQERFKQISDEYREQRENYEQK